MRDAAEVTDSEQKMPAKCRAAAGGAGLGVKLDCEWSFNSDGCPVRGMIRLSDL